MIKHRLENEGSLVHNILSYVIVTCSFVAINTMGIRLVVANLLLSIHNIPVRTDLCYREMNIQVMMNLFIGTTHFCVKCTRPFWQTLRTVLHSSKQNQLQSIYVQDGQVCQQHQEKIWRKTHKF